VSTPGSRESGPVPDGAGSWLLARDMTVLRDGTRSAVPGRCDPPGQSGTAAAALRAAADFIESAGLRSGVHVICGDGEVRISVWEPFADVSARSAIVARLAALIGGTVRQHDNPRYAMSDLRGDGAIGGLRAAVKTMLPVRRTTPLTGPGRPLAESPRGQIAAVPGKLPAGWRWVTALDVGPKHPASRKPGRTAAMPRASDEAQRLAARDGLPW
jgi:hypothetical protein